MEDEINDQIIENSPVAGKNYILPASIVAAAFILASAWIYTEGLKYGRERAQVLSQFQGGSPTAVGEEKVLPPDGVVLPVRWGDLGAKMVEAGVIDAEKFESVYAQRGGLTDDEKELLYGSDNGNLKITPENSGAILSLLWAFGLGNKNLILENGPMTDPKYGGAGRFASTGGWTIAKGDAMNHYSAHQFINLTDEQQQLVERVSGGIYRPCCGNSTYFPDCNHGMAMLGLLELLAANGVSEDEMYRVALAVNSYWFPDTYLTIANLFASRGINWEDVDPREVLGFDYSSAQGFQRVLEEIEPAEHKGGGGGCGVDSGVQAQEPPQKQRGGSGCGV